MDYYEQLNTKEWKGKRERILSRDNNICQNCKNQSFENELSSALIVIPYYHETYDRLDNYFLSLDPQKEELSPTRAIIRKSLIQTKFEKNPGILWIDYIRDPSTYLANIYFIKALTDECKAEVLRLKKLKEKISTQDVNPIDELLHLPLMYEPIALITPIQNPYYSENLLSIGKKLPICFSFCLNVHHKVYRMNKLAWEYPDDDLITLCWNCHEELHKNIKIKCLGLNGQYIGELTPCSRCFGAGWFPEYKHVENGVCFRCRGARFDEFFKA